MLGRLLTGATEGSTAIRTFIELALKKIGQNGFDIIFYISVALLVLNIIVTLIRVNVSYEKKMYRSIKKLNSFFVSNPHVSEDNLIALNSKMKTVPKNLRYCWQEYMLYRDKLPSEYMTTETCLDQPLKTSNFQNTIKSASIWGILISILSSIAFLSISVNNFQTQGIYVSTLWESLVIPGLLLSVNYIIVLILRLKRTTLTNDLYYAYHDFLRNMNKACGTMPSFIDYEVLFTQKEIKEGIPVLQEYLEKRALQEQQEAEKAKLNAQEYERFDFNELGIENAILLDRAMRESEKYFNVKRDLQEKLNSKESEINNFAKNFDEVTKDFERKAQAIKENLTQLNEQLNNTAVKIEANYIKKRHNEEQVKLQQLEKDYDLASVRFNKQQADLEEECEVLRNEIKERKSDVEEAIKVEGKAYANKVYGIINKTVAAQNEPIFAKLEADKQALVGQLNAMNQTIINQNAEIESRRNQIAQIEQDLNYKKAEIAAIASVKEYFTSLEFKQMVNTNKKKAKKGIVDISEYQQMVEQLQNQLNDKQSEIERLNNTLQQMQNELTNKQNELQAREVELQAKNQEIDLKNSEIQEKNNQLEAQAKQLEEAKSSSKQEKKEEVVKTVRSEEDLAKIKEQEQKLAESEGKKNELLKKLKNLEDIEKINQEEKAKIKRKNLNKLLAIQKDIEAENEKYVTNKQKLKKKVDDTIETIDKESKK